MPNLLYVGPLGGVRLTLPSGVEVVVADDGLLDTTPDHAASLLDQPSNWQLAPTPTDPAPAPSAPDPAPNTPDEE